MEILLIAKDLREALKDWNVKPVKTPKYLFEKNVFI